MPKKSTSKTTKKAEKPPITKTVLDVEDKRQNFILGAMPLLIFIILITVALSMNISFWPGDIIASFLPQLMILVAGMAMVYLSFVSWGVIKIGVQPYLDKIGRASQVVFVLSIFLGVYVLFFSTRLVAPAELVTAFSSDRSPISVGTFNKLYNSSNFVDDTDFLFARQVDIISLQEVDENEVEVLGEILNHDYTHITDCDCSAGQTEVAVISKFPITNAQNIYETNNSVILRTLINSDAHGEFVLYTVHLYVPNSPKSLSDRQEAYNALSEAVNSEDLPTFVMGDFNTTIFSPQLQDFSDRVETTSLAVYERYWPRCSWYGFSEIGCVRIDHVFVPSSAQIKEVRIGDENFSDHRPVVVDLAI